MRTLAIAIMLCAASAANARAAPWSFELPAGYIEQPGAADAQLAQLRGKSMTVSVDAQIYLSPDSAVQLTRMTWLMRLGQRPTRLSLDQVDRGAVAGASKQASKHISDSRHFVGDQLVADSTDEVNDLRSHRRALYSADTDGVVHVFYVICTGPADQLADCERAQQTMQLTLPNPMKLTARPEHDRDSAYRIGRVVGFLIMAVLLIAWVRSGAHIWRRPKPKS